MKAHLTAKRIAVRLPTLGTVSPAYYIFIVFSSDISRCYLRTLVDKLTSMWRLMIWYEDPINMTGMFIYRHNTMSFGDGISSIVVKITQEKSLGTMCALSETKRIVTYSAYADNYASSFQEAKTCQDVKKDMLAIHDKIGLLLKNVWTDKDIIHQVEKI